MLRAGYESWVSIVINPESPGDGTKFRLFVFYRLLLPR